MLRLFSVALGLAALLGCSEYKVDSRSPSAVLGDSDEPVPPPPPANAPDIEVEPMLLPFGFLPADCNSAPDLVTVRNVGNSDLVISDMGWVDDVGAFTHSGTGVTLAPGESYQLFVEFMPLVEGSWIDALRIDSNDPDEPSVDVLVEGTAASEGLITEGFDQVISNQVDVLFVLDNSGSMSDNIDELNARFPAFINSFINLGLDFQIGIVTTDMDDPTQSGRLQGPIITANDVDPVGAFVAQSSVGEEGSGDERGLDAAFAALEPSQGLIDGPNAGFIRPGANLSIIVVSDEDDSSANPVNQFNNWLDAYNGDPDLSSLSIIGGPRNGFLPCFGGFNGTTADPVPRYWNAAFNTGGIHGDLCSTNFTPILDQLATVSAGLRTSYRLTNLPNDPAGILVEVDGLLLPPDPTNGWTYDPASNALYFHGAGVPAEGSSVEVRFLGLTVCPQ